MDSITLKALLKLKHQMACITKNHVPIFQSEMVDNSTVASKILH
jgi:hypothetical protein